MSVCVCAGGGWERGITSLLSTFMMLTLVLKLMRAESSLFGIMK